MASSYDLVSPTTLPSDPATALAPATKQYVDKKIIARNRRTTNPPVVGTGNTSNTLAVSVIDVSASVIAGRLYTVKAPNLGIFPGSAAGRVLTQLTYTTDGTVPTVNSAILVNGQVSLPYVGMVFSLGMEATLPIAATGTLRVLLSYFGPGDQTYQMYGTAAGWPIELIIEDSGIDPGVTGTNY